MNIGALLETLGVRGLVRVNPSDSIIHAARRLREHGIGCVVVVDDQGALAGILSERDLIARVLAERPEQQRRCVAELMTRDVATCRFDNTLDEVQSAMLQLHIRHMPVVSDGLPVAMVSLRDVMRWKAHRDLRVHEMTIFAMAKLAESRDTDTGMHLERTREFATILARHLARRKKFAGVVDEPFIELIRATSPLHDIGKVGIPDCILLKPGRLSRGEFKIMKRHTVEGFRTLQQTAERFPDARFLRMACDIAAHHHERWDGTGYPDGLAGEDIPLAARIFSIADVYDALVSKRVYKGAYSHEMAVDLIRQGKGSQFDPDVVRAFSAHRGQFNRIQKGFGGEQAAA